MMAPMKTKTPGFRNWMPPRRHPRFEKHADRKKHQFDTAHVLSKKRQDASRNPIPFATREDAVMDEK